MFEDEEDEEEPKVTLPKDLRGEELVLVTKVLRQQFRGLFGVTQFDRCGHFLDHNMSPMVTDYCFWIDYAEGSHVLSGHYDFVSAVVVSEDGRYLFSGGWDNRIFIWDLADNALMSKLSGHTGNVNSLDYKAGLLGSGNSDGSIVIWDAFELRPQQKIDGHRETIWSVCFNQSGDHLASSSHDGKVRVWDVHTGEMIGQYSDNSKPVDSVVFSDHRLMAGSRDESIKVWNVSDVDGTAKCVSINTHGRTSSLTINSDASLIAVRSIKQGIIVFSLQDFSVAFMIEGRFHRVCFHPTHPTLAAITGSKWVRMVDVRDGTLLCEFSGHSSIVKGMCFTPDSSRLITCSYDKTIRIHDVSFCSPCSSS